VEDGGECFLQKDGKDPKAEEKPLTEDKRNIFGFQPETPSGRIDIGRERNHIFHFSEMETRPKWNTKMNKYSKDKKISARSICLFMFDKDVSSPMLNIFQRITSRSTATVQRHRDALITIITNVK
jgi:hypothetical protein